MPLLIQNQTAQCVIIKEDLCPADDTNPPEDCEKYPEGNKPPHCDDIPDGPCFGDNCPTPPDEEPCPSVKTCGKNPLLNGGSIQEYFKYSNCMKEVYKCEDEKDPEEENE